MKDTQKERRRYFRVSDLVGIHYRFLSESERDLAATSQPTSLQKVWGEMEDEISVAMQSIRQSTPDVHRVLDLFNQKINLAFGHGLAESDSVDKEGSLRACQVNISACGIAFPSVESPSLNQYVEIDLTLYPSNIRLQLLAAVIACDDLEDEIDGNTRLIRADYVNISDADQELLVQHVIKRQAQLLKEQREQKSEES